TRPGPAGPPSPAACSTPRTPACSPAGATAWRSTPPPVPRRWCRSPVPTPARGSMACANVRRVIVETTAGKVQGLAKRGVWQFRGIPYAQAERFQAPRPAEPWSGVRDATAFGLIAPQNPSPTEAMLGGQDRPAGEDCLVLNVFAPQPGDGARPVMVWIHGGAFVAGSGSIVWYDGSNLAREGDVVVVTINYRLGALGFLHLGHLDPAYAGSGANRSEEH